MSSAKQFGLSVGTLAVATVLVLSSQANAGWGSSGSWGSSSSGGSWGSSSSGGYGGWGSSSSSSGGYYTGSSSSSSGGWHARHHARKAARRAYRHSSSSGGWGSSSSGGYSGWGSSSSGGYSYGGSSSSSGGSSYDSHDDGGWTPVDESAPADAPAPPAADPPVPSADADASIRRMNTSVSFTVNVPEDTKIFVNDNATSSTGSERTYISRGLQAGKSYTFHVRAELVRDGETLTETKKIRLVAGQHTSLAFEFAPNANEQLAEKAVETKLTLNVPAEAKVYLSGHETTSTGPVREFATTKLIPGKSWADYVVVVTYEKDGQLLTQEKNVTINAGDAREVTFDFDTDTVASVQR